MKKSIFIVSMAAAIFWASCSKEDMQTNQTGTETGTRTVTFNLSMESGDGMSVSTRSGENSGVEQIDFRYYSVYVYWFHSDDGANYTFMGEKPEEVTDYTYTKTFDDDEANKWHKYVFVAVPKGTHEAVIADAKDFGQVSDAGWGEFVPNKASVSSSSKLNNCYIPFSESDNGEAIEGTTFSAGRNFEIFGDGGEVVSDSPTGDISNTVLRRQFGIVRINANGRDFTKSKITCKINTDYYRLYLSQMVKRGQATAPTPEAVYGYYSSENEAESGNVSGGDYFSNSYQISDGMNTQIASFAKAVTAADLDEQGNINIYLPYTTVQKTTETVEDLYQTNYSVLAGSAMEGPSLTLTIDDKEYTYSAPFPIFRNVVTAFNIKGDALEIVWDNNGGNGVDLDDDDWDGIQTANN